MLNSGRICSKKHMQVLSIEHVSVGREKNTFSFQWYVWQ